MLNLNESPGLKACNPQSSVHQPGDKDKTVSQKENKKKVKSDFLKCSRLLTSHSLSLPPPLHHSPSSSHALTLRLFLESPIGNVNRDFTAQCRCIGRAHISPTCDLHQRRGSWGIFHANGGRGVVAVMVVEVMMSAWGGGGAWSQYPGA